MFLVGSVSLFSGSPVLGGAFSGPATVTALVTSRAGFGFSVQLRKRGGSPIEVRATLAFS